MNDGEINLLPLGFRRRIGIRRGIGGWSVVTAVAVGLCLVQISLEHRRHAAHQSRVASLREANEPVQAALQNQAELRRQHHELAMRRNEIDALLPSDDLLQTLGAIATLAADDSSPAARVQALQIDLRGATRPSAGTEAAPAPTAPAASHVQMTAVAVDEASLHQLIGRMRLHERFRDVRLRGTAQNDSGGGRRVEIEAEVLVEKELPQ